jgi:hypothetical protein
MISFKIIDTAIILTIVAAASSLPNGSAVMSRLCFAFAYK